MSNCTNAICHTPPSLIVGIKGTDGDLMKEMGERKRHMAIRGASMAGLEDTKDPLEHNAVMPGFRFHPTEEELVEFYLRRKVHGKRFNVEIISFLELYRYDPWELPAMATIGEKEWFFYVPRDKKYRNGDRPNRVTTSGYWKATGADRNIRTESSKSIGLKKTLVFYSGKAPRGVRTNWIMNEYRLPREETELNQKAEISLCRVYKRSGVDENNRPSSSRAGSDKKQASRLQIMTNFQNVTPPLPIASLSSRAKDSSSLIPSSMHAASASPVEEAYRIIGYGHNPSQQFLQLQQSQLPLASQPISMTGFADKIWEWNHLL